MFHKIAKILTKFKKRFLSILHYIYEFKIIFISVSYILTSTLILNSLRNIFEDRYIGCIIVSAVALILLLIAICHLRNKDESLSDKSMDQKPRVSICIQKDVLKILLLIFIISLLRVGVYVSSEQNNIKNVKSFIGSDMVFYGHITSEPDKRLSKTFLDINMLEDVDIQDQEIGKILIKTENYPKHSIGQVCKFEGRLVEPYELEDFDYKTYLQNQKIYSILENATVECLPLDEIRVGNKIFNSLIDWKNSMIEKIDSNLHEPQASLLAGIIFGQKRSFSEKFEKAVRTSGVSHVVAASGYNVTVLILAVNKLFFFVKKQYRICLSMLIIWCFCIISGLSASIIRATIMSSIVLIAMLFGRKNSIHISIPLASAIFVFVNPAIIYDVGFQLSILATLGLVYLEPAIENLLKNIKIKIGKGFKDNLLTTLSCTLATLPISIYTFKTFSIWSVIANVLILPVIDLTMLFGVLAVILEPWIDVLSRFFYLVVYVQLKYFELVVYGIDNLGVGVFEIDSLFGVFLALFLSAFLIFFTIIYYPREE